MGLEHKNLPTLSPLVPQWEKDLLNGTNPDDALPQMQALADGPFHVLHTPTFRENLRAFIAAATKAGVEATMFFARKANKSECWLPIVAAENQGVDVASGEEFLGAVAGGVPTSMLTITGAEKSDSLLWLAARHGSTVAVDSPGELERLSAIAALAGTPVSVLLRLLPTEQPESRFGTTPDDWFHALAGHDENTIDCTGVCFHLNGYDAAQRGRQAHVCLDVLAALRERGWRANTVDIGGGFAVRYTDSADWDAFIQGLELEGKDAFHSGRQPASSYPYGGSPAIGADMLTAVLETSNDQGVSLAQRLHDDDVNIALEPGRALLDGCGLTAFGVQGVKFHDDYTIITASGLSMSLSEQWKGSEFLPDFTLWPPAKETAPGIRACVGGASCMEYDMLTWRKVPLDREPQRGDLLIYHNTAGYQMDKNESSFHQIPLPQRFVWDGPGIPVRLDQPFSARRGAQRP